MTLNCCLMRKTTADLCIWPHGGTADTSVLKADVERRKGANPFGATKTGSKIPRVSVLRK